MPGKEYRFNPETLTYEEVREPLRLRIYRLLRKGLVVIITVCIVNLLFSFVFHTPKMDRIARENEELLLRYALLDDRIREDAERLDAHAPTGHQRLQTALRSRFPRHNGYLCALSRFRLRIPRCLSLRRPYKGKLATARPGDAPHLPAVALSRRTAASCHGQRTHGHRHPGHMAHRQTRPAQQHRCLRRPDAPHL